MRGSYGQDCRWYNCEHTVDWCASEILQQTTKEHWGHPVPGGDLWKIMTKITIILIHQKDFIIYKINNCRFGVTPVTLFKHRWQMSVRSDKPVLSPLSPPAGFPTISHFKHSISIFSFLLKRSSSGDQIGILNSTIVGAHETLPLSVSFRFILNALVSAPSPSPLKT